MKNLNLFSTLLTIASLFTIGCTDTKESFNDNRRNDVSIFASHNPISSLSHSKTVIGDVLPDGELVMNWTKDDVLGVFTADGINLKFVNTIADPSPDAVFKPAADVQISSDLQVGYYPYNPSVTNRKAIPVVIPSMQEYKDETSLAQYDIKAANIVKQSDGSFSMKMNQMTSLVRFEVKMPELTKEITSIGDPADLEQIGIDSQHVKSVSISTNDGIRLTGNYTYDLSNLANGLENVASDDTNGDLTVKITNEPLLTSLETLVFYAIVAPGQHKGHKLNCEVFTENISLQFTTTIKCHFVAGNYYSIPLNSTTIANADPGTVGVVTTPDIVAPSEPVVPPTTEETANCYMINTVGEHEFWGTQIGNGAKGIIEGAGFHTDNPYINPASAKLLWQDVQNFISEVFFDPEMGKVYYTANKNVGNAVIAVYDGPNGTGNILWSWHIWGVGDQIPGDVELTNMAKAKFTMLDRTLGAHSATSCQATLYQWGRKDPFPNSSTYYTEVGEGAQAKNIEHEYPNLSLDKSTIQDGISNPDRILRLQNRDEHKLTWTTEVNLKLWGDEDKANRPWSDDTKYPDTWGYKNPEAGADWKYSKTIYDPSPVGYRVANMFTFTGFIKPAPFTGAQSTAAALKDSQTNINTLINCVKNEDGEAKFNQGYYFKCHDKDAVGVFFPMIGYRTDSGNLYPSSWISVGRQAEYWTSCSRVKGYTNSDLKEIYASGLTIGEYVGDNYLQKDKNQLQTVHDTERQIFLKGIRCVKE